MNIYRIILSLVLTLIVNDLYSLPLKDKDIQKSKILICGVAKNVEKTIPVVIQSINKLGSRFADHRVIIYENNSTDKTAEKFKLWANYNPKVIFMSETLPQEEFYTTEPTGVKRKLYRVELIARARNIVLDIVRNSFYDDYDYVMMVDLDFTKQWDIEGIMSSFYVDEEWDAITANGKSRSGFYFDMYAFRDVNYPFGPELYGPGWWKKIGLWRSDLVFRSSSPLKRVISAFGGLAIYKRSSILNCSYSSLPTDDLETVMSTILYSVPANSKSEASIQNYFDVVESTPGLKIHEGGLKWFYEEHLGYTAYPVVCEHVPFHCSMILQGFDKIYINPKMVMTY